MNRKQLGRDFDRDKNLSYRPQDESSDDIYDPYFASAFFSIENFVAHPIDYLIAKQHQWLIFLIANLKKSNISEFRKQQYLLQLVGLWTIHSVAEENALYEETQLPEVLQNHKNIDIIIEDLESSDFRQSWSFSIGLKANALAELIENHVHQGELFLNKLRSSQSNDNLLRLGAEFLRQFEAAAHHYQASLKPTHTLT